MRLLRFVVAMVSILTPLANAQSDTGKDTENAAPQRLYGELRMLLRKYYPEATSHLVKEKMHFEHNTRIFIVHEASKTGEWQDPWEERGPKRGGILCDVTLQEGPYQGAAVVPHTFDKRYFKVLFLAPQSAKHDRHLLVHLSYPADVKGEFLKEFTDLVNDFAKYLD